ncbi:MULTISPECIES: SRPBCC family protein [Streptomyces]|uniref:SRPBCC family protein n=1 Tax=Streptomyces doudnae TaxID=3075536 RepID=A0ABD5ER60_9ACTN|nr:MULTISPECIES: SRPBCC family protein [unclassified Streptomyces]MDT0437176.1 SRPBCC family protein [Streptomyces sp. DSM 41981]MYQ62104.1 polyketide cyclase [Streptomyces sp. SID4950]
MDWSHHRFRVEWTLAAPPAAVYRVLERAEDYPRWWPQVRRVTPIDADSGVVRIRATLPYTLTLTARATRRDPGAGILEVSLTGDLEGRARWTLTAHGTGTHVRYDQEVVVRRTLLRRLAVPGRAVFRANHRLMMRAGRRGLAARLEAV